jgi:hypothetical protein
VITAAFADQPAVLVVEEEEPLQLRTARLLAERPVRLGPLLIGQELHRHGRNRSDQAGDLRIRGLTPTAVPLLLNPELNATGARRVPDDAPTGFVPARWRGYLETAAKAGNTSAYWHYWELCTLLALRDGLRTGDVFVPGSRRYSDPAAYLLTPEKWALHRAEFCQLVGKPADPTRALADATGELGEALDGLEHVLAAGDGPVRLDSDGDLVISPLTAEDVPAEATALKAELTEMLPFAPIVSLLIEMDKRAGYLDCFTHASGKQTRTPELKRNLIAVLISHSTNLGLTRMADACGFSYDVLAWTAEWYVREETLRAANLAIIGYHQRLPLTPVFGTGTLSSSDGQRFPTRGKSVTARALSRYFANEGLSTYTHVTDQHTTYGTKVIVATKREAHYVLDEILGNATVLPGSSVCRVMLRGPPRGWSCDGSLGV